MLQLLLKPSPEQLEITETVKNRIYDVVCAGVACTEGLLLSQQVVCFPADSFSVLSSYGTGT